MRLTFEDELRSGSLLCGGTGLADSMVTLGEPGDGYALKEVNRMKQEHSHGKTQYIPGKQVLVRS